MNNWAIRADLADDGRRDLTIIVEDALESSLGTEIAQYMADLVNEGLTPEIHAWKGGSATDLRALIAAEIAEHGIKGAWLVGNLPAAWYELDPDVTGRHEEFPCDLYYMDPDASWGDADGDGIFDNKPVLELSIYTSRLPGGATELQKYFSRLHKYRSEGHLAPVSAYEFYDDDFSNYPALFGPSNLGKLYKTVDTVSDKTLTTAAAYLAQLGGDQAPGAEFVFQSIHAGVNRLSIYEPNGVGFVGSADIAAKNFKASFFSMNDCTASRFTQDDCLARAYLTGTDYGLATFGQSKAGSLCNWRHFHDQLASGYNWGEAFRTTYNYGMRNSDLVCMGNMILGDPMLHVTGAANLSQVRRLSFEQSAAMSADEKNRREQMWNDPLWKETMRRIAEESHLDTFEDYRNNNPAFFR